MAGAPFPRSKSCIAFQRGQQLDRLNLAEWSRLSFLWKPLPAFRKQTTAESHSSSAVRDGLRYLQ